MSCDVIINGDEQINHRRKIHKGDPSVKFKIYLGDNSKQPKLCFSRKMSEPGDQQVAGKIKSPLHMKNVNIVIKTDTHTYTDRETDTHTHSTHRHTHIHRSKHTKT